MHNRHDRQKLTASILTFVMLFQTIAGVFVPKDIFHLWNDQVANAGWFDAGYGFRKEIKIDHAKVAGNLANFPMLVSFTDPLFKTTGNGGRVTSSSGYDIIFTNASGSQKLDHEIEKYDGDAGTVVMWVKMSALSSSTDTSIYIYYGNGSVTTSQENKTKVWDDGGANNFKMVQHMNQNPGGTPAQMIDSTQYANNGTSGGGMTVANSVAGQADGATSFDGTDDYVSKSSAVSVPTSAGTISVWIRTSSNNYSQYGKQAISIPKNSTNNGLDLNFGYGGANKVRGVIITSGTSMNPEYATSSYYDGNWHNYALTYNGSISYLYADGTSVSSANGSGSISADTKEINIGRFGTFGNYFNGSIDEVRISDTARSAQWIQTEYNNQSNPTEFSTLGIEEVSSPLLLSSFGYRKAITIDHTKVSGTTNLANFPVLINLPADASLSAHAQDATHGNGGDILFTSSTVAWNTGTVNDKLAHEIETYTSATGSLQAWVKIPNLSPTTDTVIYMYYGNGSATSQQNKTVVWDSNTKMVQHMNGSATPAIGDFKDSTQYANNSANNTNEPTATAGQIDGAQRFDGSSNYVSAGSGDSLNITSAITIDAWVNPASFSVVRPIVYRLSSNNSTQGYSLRVNSAGKIVLLIGNGVGSQTELTSSATLPTGTWSHIVITYQSNGQTYLYIDGDINVSKTSAYVMQGADASLMLGFDYWFSGTYFAGSLDEVRISNTARSAQWIQTEYNNQSNPTEFSSLGIEEVSSPLLLSSFKYRKAITINKTKVSGSLNNFPVLINLPTDDSLAANAQDDNDDILFTSSNISWTSGTTNDKLAHEIESFNGTTGSLQAWVKVPNISSANDTVIYMYYGYDDSASAIANQQNKTAVWDSNTKMVQHMNGSATPAVGDFKDSTQYANNSANNTNEPTATAGQIDGAQSFDGTSSHVDVGSNESIAVASPVITIGAWVYVTGGENTYRAIVSASSQSRFHFQIAEDNRLQIYFYGPNKAALSTTFFGSANYNKWFYVTAVWDGTNGRIYINGTQEGISASGSGSVSRSTSNLTIGRGYNAQRFFFGSVDEVRISNTARSAEWIATEYNNQSNPTEFSSLGIEEVSSPLLLSSFKYRKAITIDKTKVSGSFNNFPVLVNLPTDDSLAANAQDDNDDILFTSSNISWTSGTTNDKLAHEIESFNGTTGSLQAWVKVPNISSANDTVIYMYYGYDDSVSAIANQQNKIAVWDGNTKMVQHMNQNPGGNAPQMTDSTQYGNNGTSGGTMISANSVTGQVDGATSFDGVDDNINCGNNSSLSLGGTSMSFGFWIKSNIDGLSSSAVDDFTTDWSTVYKGWALTREAGNFVRLWLSFSGTASAFSSIGTIKAADGWKYVAYTYNGVFVNTYINGVLDRSIAETRSVINNPTKNIILGQGTQGTKLSLDEVRISNTARSAEWIATEYNNQSIPLKTESTPAGFLSLSAEQIYRFEIIGSATQTAGTTQTLTLNAKDVSGTIVSNYTGDKTITFSGANAAPSGTVPTCTDKNNADIALGSPTTLAFTNGVAHCDLKLYKAETATIASSSVSGLTTNLSVTVSPNILNNFLVEAPSSSNSGSAFATAITSRDAWNNITRTVSGSTAITTNAGTVTPTSISSGNFTDDGVWSGNVTVSGIVERPSVALTATNGSSSGSDNISILGIPADPQNASAARNSDYSMTLTWQDVSTVETGYLVERKVNSGSGFGSYVQIGGVAANVSSFTDDAVSNPGNTPLSDRSYQYRVRAVNSIGNSGYGEDTAVHYTTPNTPSNVFGNRLSDNSFRVNYTDNSAITDTHHIERCSNANCGTSFETSLGTFASSPQTDSVSVYPDSRYRWQARAEAPGINSNYEVSNFEYTTPASPAIQNPVYVSRSQINVNWTDASSYEDGFRIEVSIDGGVWQEVTPGINTVGANITSYAYASAGDHNYKFRIRSHVGATPHNGELFSAYSGESSAVYTASASPIIGAPAVDSSSAITWNWIDTSAFEENFHLHFVAGSGSDVNDIPANTGSYTSIGLIPNTKYGVHVHSYRADAGESDPSAASAEVYTLANIPADLAVHADSQYQMTASWNNNQNPAGTKYYIENMNTGKNSGWIADTSWASNNLNCGTKYSFRVKARNESGTETSFLGIVDGMTQDCSPGLPSSYAQAPKPPQKTADNPKGELKIVINKDEKYTANPIVALSLFAGSDTVRMALSNSTNFKDALLVPFQKEIKWNLESSGADVSGDGARTVYAKFYTKYGISSQAVSDAIILDTTAPAFDITHLKDEYYLGDNVSVSGKTETGARIIYSLDGKILGAADAAEGIFAIDLGTLPEGEHTLKLFARDALGNSSDVKTLTFSVEKIPAPVSPAPIPANPAPQSPGSRAVPSHNPAPPSQPSQTPEPSSPSATPSVPSPSIPAPAPSVPQETPVSMSGEWNLLKIKPFPSGISTQDIGMIVEKFPEFKELFKSLGINDFTDSQQLRNASLMIPGISEVVGLNSAGLSSNLPVVTTPVAQLSASMKKEIPQNILFVRTKDGNMDINSDLAFENGAPNQRVSLLPGKSFELVLRPDGEMNSVKGYLTYKEKQTSMQETQSVLDKISVLLSGRPAHAQEDIEEKLVLSEFDYNDDDKDGIWTADISTPQVTGEYELITVLNYKDVKIGSKTIRMITVIDPEGYVYRQEKDGEKTRITNAVVSLYWFNSETKKYELWNAEKYQQKNPQTTDDRGTYSFLVPPGSYYLEVRTDGYQSYQGKPFDVTAGNGVHANIELIPVLDWKDQITWERVIIAVFGIALGCNFYWDRRARKKLKANNL